MGWASKVGGALAAVVMAGAAATALAQAEASAPLVRTADGPVQGTLRDDVRAFTAIPFAAPPVGPLRFRAPQPVAKWTKPLIADKPIPNCIQFGGGPPGMPQSEDCLYLSVWAPRTASPGKPVPVMVWIFGGGLVGGGAQAFDGSKLARDGVVVVTLNYRLGVLGMMADPSLDEGKDLSGDYLVRDQQAALRWVQRNVRAFGGDPGNVTLFGESSGGSSVLVQVVSPEAKGLFHKAIVESSGGAYVYRRGVVEAGAAQKVIRAVGCAGKADVAACLRAAPAQAFVDAKVNMDSSGEDAANALGLVTDPDLLPMDTWSAVKSGRFNKTPMLTGTNVNEAALWVMGDERRLGRPLEPSDLPALARREYFGQGTDKVLAAYPIDKQGSPELALMHAVTDFRQACPTDSMRRDLVKFTPVYGYEMTEPDPAQSPPDKKITGLPNTPHHGTEVAYVFGFERGQPLTGRAEALSARFRRFWTNFAKFGSPDPTGRVWPRFTPAHPVVMSLQEPPHLSADFTQRHNCAFMRSDGLTPH